MTEIITDAVILRQYDYGENDRILTVLTPEHGLMTVGAKGVRNFCSKNSSAVQLFCYSELELLHFTHKNTLRTAYLKNSFSDLGNTVPGYALACYAADVALHFCTEENDETEPFRLLLNYFYAVSKNEKPLWLLKAAFELKLCTVCGFLPELGACACCGRPTTDVASPDKAFLVGSKYRFSLMESGLICRDCYEKACTLPADYTVRSDTPLPRDYTRAVSFAAVNAARFVASAPLPRFVSFRLDERDAPDFSELCEQYLLFHAERGFDTLKYYKSLK